MKGLISSCYTLQVTVVSGTRHQLTGLRESTLYRVLVVSENDVGSSLPELTLLFVTNGMYVLLARFLKFLDFETRSIIISYYLYMPIQYTALFQAARMTIFRQKL